MELQFKKVGSRWEAEFEATGDFNLHVERKKSGGLALYQKSPAGEKFATDSSWSDNAPAVVDKDFSMVIYPKMIKVVSRSEPIQGVATMEGEGGSGSDGVKVVPLIDQCRVTWCNYGGDVTADGMTLTPNETGVFTHPAGDSAGVIRVFSPFLYIPSFMNEYPQVSVRWNETKQCFDLGLIGLEFPQFTLNIIE